MTASTADDRETLSALFDGELHADAVRFAAKRLGHDLPWRQSVERWQLIGDVMRGQAALLAPAGFAERVADAVQAPVVSAVEAPVVSTSAARAQAPSATWRSARWWGGMALAASVAAAAVLVLPWAANDVAPTPVAVAPAVTTSAPPVAVAVTETPRIARVTTPRPQARRARAATNRLVARVQADTRRAPASTPRPNDTQTVAARVFQPPVEDTIVTRPWPRATLPELQGTGAFTAGYNTRASTPSFYPFEPDADAVSDAPSPSP